MVRIGLRREIFVFCCVVLLYWSLSHISMTAQGAVPVGLKPVHITALRRAACRETPLEAWVDCIHKLARNRVLPYSVYTAPILERFETDIVSCTSIECTARMLHACARLRLATQGRALIDQCVEQWRGSDTTTHPQQRISALTSILWACAALDHRLPATTHEYVTRLAHHDAMHITDHAALRQLWAAETYAQRMGWWDATSSSSCASDPELWAAACRAWSSTFMAGKVSAMQRDVHMQLQRLVDGSGHYTHSAGDTADWLRGWDVTMEGRVEALLKTDVLLQQVGGEGRIP